MKKRALITGASAGIGWELAQVFAEHGFNLVLVARRVPRLQELAQQLRAEHGVDVRVLAKDLSNDTACHEIVQELQDTPISVLVNNAGFGWHGAFVDQDPENAIEMMRVNMDALVSLTRLLVPEMVRRREGKILNVSSIAAFQPGPFSAIYYATKAFVFSFSCALAEELSGSGVTVTALCPGGTHSEFHARAGGKQRVSRYLPMMAAREVAEAGFHGLMKGKLVVVPGAVNQITSFLSRRMPTWLVTRMVGKMNRNWH